MSRVLPFLLSILCALLPQLARAQYDEVEQDSSFKLRAVLDVRLAHGGPAPSWVDGGTGKTRYGGRQSAGGFERETRLELSQLAIELSGVLPGGIRAQAQVNLQPDLSDDDAPWLIEALLRKEWGADANGWGLQAGVMNIPFSLEHTGPAWSAAYTISASALDNWLWEEISLAGVEGEWWHITRSGVRLGALVGTGFGPDRLGRLVAVRGWALGDGLSGIGDLPLPSGERMDIFHERDGRPSAYAWLSAGDADERASIRLGVFDNFGDQNTDGLWHTRFATIGAIFHPHPRIDAVAQYLSGEAHVRATTNDSSLRAYYGLLSYHQMRHRITLRYDSFRVNDLDGGSDTRETGSSWTAAYFLELGLRHRIGVESIWLDSRRNGVATPQPAQDSWQLSYRFRY